MTNTYSAAARGPGAHVPVVCPACNLVSRTPVAQLGTSSLACVHCGHTRPPGTLAAHIPGNLARIEPRKGLVRLSEFPNKTR